MHRMCEMCPLHKPSPATVFCPADESFLCTSCDEVVHSANRLARRHVRRPLNPNETDGSSINEESELCLVPDTHVADCSDSLMAPDVSFEDAAGYDFLIEGGNMPPLGEIGEEELFAGSGGFGKDLEWGDVVLGKEEGVVPDVEEHSTMVAKTEHVEIDLKLDVKVEEKVVQLVEEKEDLLCGKKRAREEEEEEEERLERSKEQRKKRRMEALARFRSKRANRSFTKKVRYECRKQLADSRPRVKGRFVRKIEMALYRKYGALYRDHLDELKEVNPKVNAKSKPSTLPDQCVPAI